MNVHWELLPPSCPVGQSLVLIFLHFIIVLHRFLQLSPFHISPVYMIQIPNYVHFIFHSTQIKGILQNMTQIEEWIVEKAHHRRLKQMRQRFSENEIEEEEEEEEEEDNSKKGKGKGKGKKKTNGKATEKDGQKMKRKAELLKPFVYPYNLGWKRNFTQVRLLTSKGLYAHVQGSISCKMRICRSDI